MAVPLLIRLARSVRTISPTEIASHLAEPNPLPLRILNLIGSWPALRRWHLKDELQGLRNLIGEHTAVEVELGRRGRGYLDADHRRVTMGLGTFLNAFVLGTIPFSPTTAKAAKGEDKWADLPIGYLAQHDLTPSPAVDEAMPMLRHYQSGPRQEFWRRTLWVGPKSTWTPFHRDPYIGIYSQLVGAKTFHLLPPTAAALLDLAPPPQTNTSSIPVPISALFPSPTPTRNNIPFDVSDVSETELEYYRTRLREAFRLPGACQAFLSAGESVLIPEGWYHSAEGNETGVGVTAWFR